MTGNQMNGKITNTMGKFIIENLEKPSEYKCVENGVNEVKSMWGKQKQHSTKS